MNVSTILSCQSRLRPVTREPSDVDSTGPVAQWSELAAHNRLVGGSSPPGPTNAIQWLMGYFPAQHPPEDFEMATNMATFCRVGPSLTNRSRVVAFRDDTSHQTA